MDAEERREQILVAALKVFGERGFSEASNRDIADAAGLKSAALIYHYFPSKLELLRAVAERFSPIPKLTENPDRFLQLPPEQGLREIGEMYITLFANPEVRPLMKVILGESLKSQEFAGTFAKIGPLRIIGFLARYLSHLMDQGIIRRTDPVTAARSFLGPFVAIFMFRTVFGTAEEFPVDEELVVDEGVRIFLDGIRERTA
jgi:AcrR family transcriptional regulator